MPDKGWIKLHRKLLDCWIWQEDEPFDKRSAWIDLLLKANHSDKKILFNGQLIIVKKGQILTSVRKLSSGWNWSVNKVYRFLKLLENDGMLKKESDKDRTLLTIENYGVYQFVENTNGNTNEHMADTPTETPAEHKQELKNIKNERNNIYVCSFEELWKIYPRKVNKGAAYKCYMARLHSGYSEEELLRATQNYARECEVEHTEQKYIKHASTFFGSSTPFVDYLKGDSNGFSGRNDNKPEADAYADEFERLLNGE